MTFVMSGMPHRLPAYEDFDKLSQYSRARIGTQVTCSGLSSPHDTHGRVMLLIPLLLLTVFNSLRGSKLFEYLKLPVPLEARRL